MGIKNLCKMHNHKNNFQRSFKNSVYSEMEYIRDKEIGNFCSDIRSMDCHVFTEIYKDHTA